MSQKLLPDSSSAAAGNSLSFFFEGDAFFATLKQYLEQARRSIDLELYYLASDRVGWNFALLLVAKAKAGVRCRLIYDAVGCRGTAEEIFNYLEGGGVHIKKYNPVLPLPRNLRRRDHRKFIVIDGRIGMLGGYNLAEEYSQEHSGARGWRDSGVFFAGETLAGQLSRLFEMAWQGEHPHLQNFLSKQWRRPPWREGGRHIVANYGWRRKSLIRQEYLAAIIHARRSFYITNSYFVPGHGVLRALRRAARRGVDVRLLTAGISDVPIVRWAGQATYATLMKAGVRVYEYQGRVLHAKSAVADREWFTLGTSNIDALSFFHNLEVNLFGRDPKAGEALETQFFCDLQNAQEILPEKWKRRSCFAKFREKFFYFFRAWL